MDGALYFAKRWYCEFYDEKKNKKTRVSQRLQNLNSAVTTVDVVEARGL
jgi:hypothetical protein